MHFNLLQSLVSLAALSSCVHGSPIQPEASLEERSPSPVNGGTTLVERDSTPLNAASDLEARAGCNKKFRMGGSILFAVVADTMNAALDVYAVNGDGHHKNHCEINQTKSFSSSNTHWKGSCNSGGSIEVIGERSGNFRLLYHHKGATLKFPLKTTRDNIYKCAEEGKTEAPINCEDLDFQGCYSHGQ